MCTEEQEEERSWRYSLLAIAVSCYFKSVTVTTASAFTSDSITSSLYAWRFSP
jgi:hypothetical protein